MLDSPKDCSSERLQFITNGKAFIADCPSAAQRYVTHLRRTGIDYMGLNLLTKCTEKMIVCVCVCRHKRKKCIHEYCVYK